MTLLAKKSILVTGGASGIGRAAALIMARAGAGILVTDTNEAGAAETARRVNDEGNTAHYLRVDVADETDVAAMVDFAVEKFGRLDGAFNNAGVQMTNKSVDELSLAEWERVCGINLTGVFLCMKYEIAAMRKTGGGAIVNMASGAAITGIPYAVDYVATKHGVLGVTRAASCEAGVTKVRVNAVMPGLIRTPMTDDLIRSEVFRPHAEAAKARHSIGRFGEPEDVAYAVKWLLSDEAAFVNGAGLAVDGGFTAR